MDNKNNENQLNIELSEEMAEGTYSNLAIITHSNAEFVVDFIRVMPGVPKAKVKSRIVLTPQHAKRLLMALGDNILKYLLYLQFLNQNSLRYKKESSLLRI